MLLKYVFLHIGMHMPGSFFEGAAMPDSSILPLSVQIDRAEADIETHVVIDVLAMLHARIEAVLAEGPPAAATHLPDLAAQMLQDTTEVWKSVGRNAFEEAERHLAGIAVDAILALMACRGTKRL